MTSCGKKKSKYPFWVLAYLETYDIIGENILIL